MAILLWPNDKKFFEYIKARYKGKVWRIERSTSLREHQTLVVRVEFHIPTNEADELEIYRRINRVLEVVAEGGEDESTQ